MRDFSSLTGDLTHVPCSGSSESQPLDRQGIPQLFVLYGKKHFYKIIDIGRKLLCQTDAEFNVKIKCFAVLAFLPVSDITDGFIQLTGGKELVSYFEAHDIGRERG